MQMQMYIYKSLNVFRLLHEIASTCNICINIVTLCTLLLALLREICLTKVVILQIQTKRLA